MNMWGVDSRAFLVASKVGSFTFRCSFCCWEGRGGLV